MKTYDIVGYVYEAAVHCQDCAVKRFPQLKGDDREGNPICAYMVGDAINSDYDTYCDDCHEVLYEQD